MSTTHPAVKIGEVDGKPVFLEEGKGDNISVVTYGGKSAAVGHADWALGHDVAQVYADWYAANR